MKKIYFWLSGPFLVMIAGALWSLDAVIRSKIGAQISPSMIVFLEHVVGLVLLLPFLPKAVSEIKSFTRRDWLISACIALVASVLGTLLFTTALSKSFGLHDFTTPIFLQKFQPIFAILLAVIFLGEHLLRRFYLGLVFALVGSYLVTFGDTLVDISLDGKFLILILSVGAALAWGSGTVLGRAMSTRASFSTLTIVRFALAIPIALIVMSVLDPSSWTIIFSSLTTQISVGSADHFVTMPLILGFVLIGLFTGAGALLIYYRGLVRTPAHIATLCELTFPIVTFLIAMSVFNPYGAPEAFNVWRCVGMVVLLAGIVIVSWPRKPLKN